MYIEKLADIVNKCNHTYHCIIKMKPTDVKSSTYIDYDVENNEKYPKFEVVDHARILQYKNTLQKIRFQIGRKKFL